VSQAPTQVTKHDQQSHTGLRRSNAAPRRAVTSMVRPVAIMPFLMSLSEAKRPVLVEIHSTSNSIVLHGLNYWRRLSGIATVNTRSSIVLG
jgi:hypothetical protein